MLLTSSRQLDPVVEDSVRRFPTVDLVRMLFPDVRFHGRSVMCSPFRDDRHPSFSCFRDQFGYSRWKDHATGESGDNVDLYRKAFAGQPMDYPEAVDRLSILLFGHHAMMEPSSGPKASLPRSVVRERTRRPVKEPEPALRIVSEHPFVPGSVPQDLLSYQRSREISDEVSRRYCLHVVFENTNLSGRNAVDAVTGLPVVDADGRPVPAMARQDAVAIPNDIGGRVLRVPEGAERKGFKGSNRSFLTTILADGSAPVCSASFFGLDRDPMVRFVRLDVSSGRVFFNGEAGVFGLERYALPYALPFLGTFVGSYLEGRERDCAEAVLRSLNGPVNTVATVVEGMHDALSLIEIERANGHGSVPGTDLIVLNSVSNVRWAVPFLAMHREVRSLLDNDLRTSAGEKTFSQMERLIAEYVVKTGLPCRVKTDSAFFYPHKDVNDYLVASRKAVREARRVSDGRRQPGTGQVQGKGRRPGDNSNGKGRGM